MKKERLVGHSFHVITIFKLKHRPVREFLKSMETDLQTLSYQAMKLLVSLSTIPIPARKALKSLFGIQDEVSQTKEGWSCPSPRRNDVAPTTRQYSRGKATAHAALTHRRRKHWIVTICNKNVYMRDT